MQKTITIFLFVYLALCSFTSWAQINPSDGCVGANSLNVTAGCTANNYTLAGSFSNGGLINASCAAGNDRDDGWYQFTATSTTTYINATGDQARVLAVFSACPPAAELACDAQVAGTATAVTLATVIGNTYFIQLHRRSGNNNATMTGTICVSSTPPPANDDCGGAVAVAVNPDQSCGAVTSGTIALATASTQDPAACGGTEDDDVWYSFVATGSTHTIDLLNVSGSTTDLYHSVWSGGCPGLSLVAGSCSDPNSSVVNGLTAGNTYYIRVYTWTGTTGQNTTFNVCVGTPPPPPANDDCGGAVAVTVNPDQNCGAVTAGTIASATASTQDPAACGGTEDDDVWYSFVATGSTHTIDLLNVSGSTTDLYHSVWSGGCPGLSLVAGSCSDPNSSVVNGLTAGNTYYIRVYTWTGTTGQNTTFDVCVGTPPPPPANDDCGGAVAVTVNPDRNCGSVTAGTITSATASTQDPAACGGTEDDDVWFSFVATGSTHTIDLLNITGSTTDMYHSVWEGGCPGLNLVAGSCSDPEASVVSGLTAGNTYYIRVYTWTGTTGQNTTFDVCVGTPPPPPANDDCGGAVAVTVNPDRNCGAVTAGTITSATASTQDPAACGGTEDDDVWFSFVATGTSHTIDLLNITGSTTDLYHSVWSGGCPGLSLLAGSCSDPNASIVSGLTAGNTYYIRVYTWTGTTGQNVNFDVCVGTPPPPPANDECRDAIVAPVNPDLSCSAVVSGTITSATASTQDPAACGGTEDDDVWFSFVATSTSHTLELQNIVGSTTDLYHSVWEGPCGAATLFAGSCSDPNSSSLTGLTIGNTYYVRVYSFTSTTGQDVTFDLCIGTIQPITNDDCNDAINIPVNPDMSCTSIASGHTNGATQSLAGCTGTADDDVWFSFDATSTSHNIALSNIRALSGTSTDMVFEVFSGTCGSLVSETCSDPNSTNLTGLTVGATYFVRVYSYFTTSTNAFDICITTPVPPPSCSGNPAPTDDCTPAPLINNLNGFCGTTSATYNATTHGNLGTEFCGSIENNSFFQFQATDPTVSLNYWISGAGCTSGIQIEVFSVTGLCATGTWTSVSTCLNPSGAAGTNGNYVVNGLTAGEVYYVMIDGFGGDVCDYVFQADLGILLAVEFASFSAVPQATSNRLTWATAQENNTIWHIVERSYDGVNFEEIGREKAAGTSTELSTYSFDDVHPLQKGYYRIRTLTLSGEERLSQVITVERQKQNVPLINVFPIPTDDELLIQYDSPRKEKLAVKITNMVGALVKKEDINLNQGLNTIPLSLEELPDGVYILHIHNSVDQRILQKKVIKN